MQHIDMLGLTFFSGTPTDALTTIDHFIDSGKPHCIFTPNLNHIALLNRERKFIKKYNSAELLLIDGAPLVWLARVFLHVKATRINGTNMVEQLLYRCNQKRRRVFFLGSTQKVLQKLKGTISRSHPRLQCHYFAPPFRDHFNEEELQIIYRKIIRCKPHVLFVSFGALKQEKFITRAKSVIRVPVSMGVGNAFEYIAHVRPRAPRWIQWIGFEWLFRLFQEPGRLWKRYVYDLSTFIKIYMQFIIKKRRTIGYI